MMEKPLPSENEMLIQPMGGFDAPHAQLMGWTS